MPLIRFHLFLRSSSELFTHGITVGFFFSRAGARSRAESHRLATVSHLGSLAFVFGSFLSNW
jgi:hypothetical protein